MIIKLCDWYYWTCISILLICSACAPVVAKGPVVKVEIPIGGPQCLAVPGPVIVSYYGDTAPSEPLAFKVLSEVLDFGLLRQVWED